MAKKQARKDSTFVTTPQAQRGYTIVELMLIVLILGILAALALTANTIYVTRARVTEGLAQLPKPKYALVEFYACENRWPEDNAEAGLVDPDLFAQECAGIHHRTA